MELDKAAAVLSCAVEKKHLAIAIGKCKVWYQGRAASKLSEGDRLLVIKHDGTFLVHQSAGMKAINYQGPGSRTEVSLQNGILTVTSKRSKPLKEEIRVEFSQVSFADSFQLQDDKKLKVFGSERELSDLLMQDLSFIEPGLVPLQKESWVKKGTIDIMAKDFRGRMVVIEVKRRQAGLDAVTQLARYVEDVSRRKDVQTRGILCAPGVTDSALRMLESYGLEFYRLDYEIGNPSAKIKGLQKKQRALNEFELEP